MKELLKGFVDTPPLWKNQQFGLDQFKFPHQDISDIPIAVWPKNLRLGHQMEYVFYTLVQAGKNYEVALHNILVEEGKIRVGELDFILRNLTTNRYFHVELAYKFYIINPEILTHCKSSKNVALRHSFLNLLNKKYQFAPSTQLVLRERMVKENAPMLWMKTPTGNLEKLFVVWW